MKRLRLTTFTPVSKLTIELLDRLKRDESSLKFLIFSSRNLGYQGAEVLSKALVANTRLEALDLSSNRIEASGAYYIALLLTHQTKTMKRTDGVGGIKSLILGDNNIRDEGVRSIANALENNEILESLWIDNNCIGASGLEVLARSLVNNKKLEKLHLRHNSFQSLHSLIRCTFNKDSLDSIADSNHTLKYVFLNCGYSYECDELESILKINRMGKVRARKIKLAHYFEADMRRLFELDINPKLLPSIFEMLGETSNLSTAFSALRDLSSVALMFHENKDTEFNNDQMDVD